MWISSSIHLPSSLVWALNIGACLVLLNQFEIGARLVTRKPVVAK